MKILNTDEHNTSKTNKNTCSKVQAIVELKKIWYRQIKKGICVCSICGKSILRANDLSVDHVIPKSKGGTNTIDNLKPAHKKCNSKKNDKILFEVQKKLYER